MAVTFRAASGGQSSTAALTASVTQPAGATTGDLALVAINIKNSTSDTFQALSGWTLSSQDANAASIPFKTAVYWKVLTAGDTWPITITWASTTAKFAWVAVAFTPGSGNTMAIDGEAAVKVDTAGATTHTANSQAAVAASVCSVVFNCGRNTASGATGATVTPPASWTEPANGDQTTASGTTTALAQLGVEACYRTGQSGTVAPGAATWSLTDAANVYHFLLKDVAATTNAPAGVATGTGAALKPVQASPPLELSNFGSFPGTSSLTTVLSVSLTVGQFTTNALMSAPTYELWDYSVPGSPAIIGTAQAGSVSTSGVNRDTVTFTGVTGAQLATLRVRIYGHQGTAPSGAQQLIAGASLTVTFVPGAPTAGLATAAGTAKSTTVLAWTPLAHATGIAQGAQTSPLNVYARLAPATGTAQQATTIPAAGSGATANAGLAAGTGTVPPSSMAQPVQATGAGTALSPGMAQAGLATGTGAASANPAQPAANVIAGLATAAGTAQSTGMVQAIPATSAGTAQPAAVAFTVSVLAGLASGTGAARAPTIAAPAGLASGAGTAQPAAITSAASVTAGLAAGTGAAWQPGGQNAGLASAAGAAQPAAVSASGSASANAGLASGTGTGFQAGGQNAGFATAAGTAQNATVSSSSSGTANAVVATGTAAAAGAAAIGVNAAAAAGAGAAQAAIPAVGVTTGAASGTGTALNATVSTSASGSANAVLASGAGAAQSPVPAIGVNATLASGTGAAQSAGRGATAGLAGGTGAAQSPAAVLAVLAQAPAAQALGAAPNATARGAPAFTVGTLTAATAPGGTLTASDTRTGGPGG